MGLSIDGPGGKHRVTKEIKTSVTGKKYTKKTVHIGLNEQKWVPAKIDTKNYSSLNKIKKQYPGAEVQTFKDKDGTITYEIYPEGYGEAMTVITVKDDVKGSHIRIAERQNGFIVTGEYEDGKLVKAHKSPEQDDPYEIWD